VFENDKGKKYTKFSDVRVEIERLTDEKAGRNKGLLDDPILLTVYGTQSPDLTLIDLPGIARIPLKGSDQTEDIERLTREMATRYAKDPRTIILAVTPANADLATSDALQIANNVDPKGFRTIGVITKIDLMDRGTDARRMISGEDYRLHLGYIGIKNRSQADIVSGKSIKDTLEDEATYFTSHPVYRTLPPTSLGTKALVDRLTSILFKHIRHFLPEIKREINMKMRTVGQRLDELGVGVPVDTTDRVHLIWTMVTDYCEIFKNTIRGKYDKRLQTYFEHQDITGGAVIRSIFNELLEDFVDKSVTSDMTDNDIDNAIRMHEGDSLPGFPSPDTFEYLILPYLRNVNMPVFDCLDRVAQSLELLSQTIANRVFGRFPKLSEQVLELAQSILLREKENTKNILENVVLAETGYLFTNDSKYLTDHGSMIPTHEKEIKPTGGCSNGIEGQRERVPKMPEARSGSQIMNEVTQTFSSYFGHQESKRKVRYSEAFLREIRNRLDAYFSIVLRNVRDSVPKTIGFFLVRELQEKLQFELYNELNEAEKLRDLLGEPPHIVEERKTLVAQMKTFKKASQVLQKDPNIGIDERDEAYDAHIRSLSAPHGKASLGAHEVSKSVTAGDGPANAIPPVNPTTAPYAAKGAGGFDSPSSWATKPETRAKGLFEKPTQHDRESEKDPVKRQASSHPLFS